MSATSEEINKEIEQIATISRETSGSSAQTAQASGEPAKLSVTLQDIVGEFRLQTADKGNGAPPSPSKNLRRFSEGVTVPKRIAGPRG
jgi:hypothetical protein